MYVENNKTWKEYNTEIVQLEKNATPKKCTLEITKHEKSTTRKKCDVIKVQLHSKILKKLYEKSAQESTNG